MTSSSKKFLCIFKIKFPTKRIFRISPILRINGMAPFCNLFIERPSYYYVSRNSLKCASVSWQSNYSLLSELVVLVLKSFAHAEASVQTCMARLPSWCLVHYRCYGCPLIITIGAGPSGIHLWVVTMLILNYAFSFLMAKYTQYILYNTMQ